MNKRFDKMSEILLNTLKNQYEDIYIGDKVDSYQNVVLRKTLLSKEEKEAKLRELQIRLISTDNDKKSKKILKKIEETERLNVRLDGYWNPVATIPEMYQKILKKRTLRFDFPPYRHSLTNYERFSHEVFMEMKKSIDNIIKELIEDIPKTKIKKPWKLRKEILEHSYLNNINENGLFLTNNFIGEKFLTPEKIEYIDLNQNHNFKGMILCSKDLYIGFSLERIKIFQIYESIGLDEPRISCLMNFYLDKLGEDRDYKFLKIDKKLLYL